jgi:hypothetical protein
MRRFATAMLLCGALVVACGEGGDETTTVADAGEADVEGTSTTTTETTIEVLTTTTLAEEGDTEEQSTTTTRPPAPATTDVTATAAAPESNLTRNGPREPFGTIWPRDDPDPYDRDQRWWLEGVDMDGWVIEISIDWRDGSPVETYSRSIDDCGPYESAGEDDPYPGSHGEGKLRQAVTHVYPDHQMSFDYTVTTTSVSCDGDEPQVRTQRLGGGVFGSPTTDTTFPTTDTTAGSG